MARTTPEIQLGDTLQCGVVFSRPADRVPQKVVVFFAVNSVIMHHCRLQADYGGLYPTVAFSSSGRLLLLLLMMMMMMVMMMVMVMMMMMVMMMV